VVNHNAAYKTLKSNSDFASFIAFANPWTVYAGQEKTNFTWFAWNGNCVIIAGLPMYIIAQHKSFRCSQWHGWRDLYQSGGAQVIVKNL